LRQEGLVKADGQQLGRIWTAPWRIVAAAAGAAVATWILFFMLLALIASDDLYLEMIY
jgi:hypothetical protein